MTTPTSVFVPPIVPGAVETPLARIENAVPLARKLVRNWFQHWRAPTHITEASELVVCELVTNAIANASGAIIHLRIGWTGSAGIIEVWDGNPVSPQPQQARASDTGGRGLFLVGAYSVRWGCYASAGGKVVWAELKPRVRGEN